MKLELPAPFIALPLGFLPQASDRMYTLASYEMERNHI